MDKDEIEDLEKDIEFSKRKLGYLSGKVREITEGWLKEKEEKLTKLKESV